MSSLYLDTTIQLLDLESNHYGIRQFGAHLFISKLLSQTTAEAFPMQNLISSLYKYLCLISCLEIFYEILYS